MSNNTTIILGAVCVLLIVILIGKGCQEAFGNPKIGPAELQKYALELKNLSDAGKPVIKFEHFGNAVSDAVVKKVKSAAGVVASGQGKRIGDFEKIIGGEISPIAFARIMESQRNGTLTDSRVREILDTGGMMSRGLTGQAGH